MVGHSEEMGTQSDERLGSWRIYVASINDDMDGSSDQQIEGQIGTTNTDLRPRVRGSRRNHWERRRLMGKNRKATAFKRANQIKQTDIKKWS